MMVSAASAAICYVRTTTGGTSKTLEYAKKKNLRIINIEIDRNTQPKKRLHRRNSLSNSVGVALGIIQFIQNNRSAIS